MISNIFASIRNSIKWNIISNSQVCLLNNPTLRLCVYCKIKNILKAGLRSLTASVKSNEQTAGLLLLYTKS